MDQEYRVPRNSSNINNWLKRKYTKIWNSRWNKEKTCRQTRKMVPRHDDALMNFMFSTNRNDLSLLTQFITGHNYLRYHKFNSGQFTRRPRCRLCNYEREDAWHLLADCVELLRDRLLILKVGEFERMPQPKDTILFIRNSQIVKLMEPEEEAEDQDPPPQRRRRGILDVMFGMDGAPLEGSSDSE